jgi:hypothetical protein
MKKRFGSFEIFLAPDRMTGGRGPSHGNNQLLEKLLDFVCDNYFKDVIKLKFIFFISY